MNSSVLRNASRGAVLIALGVLLPMAFHAAGAAGSIFLPMHIPILMAGLLLGPVTGAWVGILTPIASSLLTGMPPLFPTLPIMVIELAVYGCVAGCLRQSRGLNVALAAAILSGRLAAGFMVWVLAHWVALQWTPWGYLAASAIKGIPGLIVQLLFIPLLVKRLEGWIHS